MSRPSIPSLIASISVAAGVGLLAWWLITQKSEVAKSEKPNSGATIDKVVKEADLSTVMLTPDAEKQIHLQLGVVEKKKVRRMRMYGGEATIPAGRTILIAAPLGGTLKAPKDGVPKAGSLVKAKQPIFELTPFLSPDGRATLAAALADAEGQVNNAKAQMELMQIALDRAKRVLKEGAGSQRQVDEALTAHHVSTQTFDAATSRQMILKKVIGDAASGTATPITIEAPQDGILRVVSALPGQTVPLGAALFEVVDLSTMWVRMPLPVGDLDSISRHEIADVGKLSAPANSPLTSAKPASAPPSANPLSATIDIFYEVPNIDGKFTPGQRLGVRVPLADADESLTVPWSAVVFDMLGGNWIYEQVGDHKYARRRIAIAYTYGTDVVLTDGPASGTKIVTAGVMQLFGAETGFVK